MAQHLGIFATSGFPLDGRTIFFPLDRHIILAVSKSGALSAVNYWPGGGLSTRNFALRLTSLVKPALYRPNQG
jgi:chaperone required for assembly of F1-ATPase